jgi:hypothetical protein
METLEGRLLDSTKNMFARIVVRQHGRGSGFRPRPHSGGPGHTGCPLLGGPLWTILNRAGCHLSHLSFLKLSVIQPLLANYPVHQQNPLTGAKFIGVMTHKNRAPTPHHRLKAQRYRDVGEEHASAPSPHPRGRDKWQTLPSLTILVLRRDERIGQAQSES